MFLKIICSVLFFQANQQAVLDKCIKAEPRHGEFWTNVSKNTKNWRKKTGEILPLVSKVLKSVESL